ncbi:MAG TPA: prepilin-type N-terminal cleavage/methylation domain-containing protein [Chromatiaceae bacterium]|jgi:type IV fimbrial biogenesis protein FimT|nr:prepilin-type N-terminal cleavage/methylation domain-containing protein [Chromatiaceae bacterium]HIB83617.1 prepilin-type N-terminal cleavage/methylation domain-containing protein [Chromatiaceae bacterium]HIN82880.1 prepilin-type N-terminal cleavage/methylation domain-containing protein [Chromatiales bacterium]HIO13621.1 prepilin-type N-terminal cleavage/methylation domain-containing protein [Chromatiales bacterium]HIO54799.1 prepilin-type N-terminal cleavage/methylation domain-containing pr
MMNKQPGFTLIESLVAILVLGILTTIAIPSFSDMMANSRLTAASNDLAATLNLARSEAVKRATTVSVCRSVNGAACDNGAAWAVGWIVFTDAGVAGTVDGTDEILRVHAAVSTKVTITATAFTSSGVVSFQSDGQEADSDSGRFDICDTRAGENMRRLNLAQTGRVQFDRSSPLCA